MKDICELIQSDQLQRLIASKQRKSASSSIEESLSAKHLRVYEGHLDANIDSDISGHIWIGEYFFLNQRLIAKMRISTNLRCSICGLRDKCKIFMN